MAVTGHAMAGGVLVVCTGDVRIGAEGNFNLGLKIDTAAGGFTIGTSTLIGFLPVRREAGP
jgi:hypothetical protein